MKIFKKTKLLVLLLAFVCALTACNTPNANYALNLTADKTVACPGEVVNFTTEVIGDKIRLDIVYDIIEGSEYATITEDGVLTVNSNAIANEVIQVISKTTEKPSNVVSITIGTSLTAIEASANKSEIIQGQSAELSAVLLPETANTGKVEWVIVEGSEACTITSNLLVVKETAEKGAKIKVKAVCDGIESNVLEFTVLSAKSEKLFLSVANSLVIDKNSNTSPILQATIYDAEYNIVTDQILDYEVISGAEYLEVTSEDNVCSFKALGHGTATVKTTIRGTNYTATTTIDVIVPPTALSIPDVFAQRVNYQYNFSKVDSLPFVVTALGDNVCQDIEVTFMDQTGSMGASVATYENGQITFNKTGLITVVAKSASGSKNEVSTSYTFNVNNGINVYTFEELQTLLASSTYNGQIVNIVVLEKPTTDAYEYGYDLVPAVALDDQSNLTFADINSRASIAANNKSVYINGNQHNIDASQVRTFGADDFGANYGHAKEKQIKPVLSISATQNGLALDVKLYDFSVIGNCPINYGATSEGTPDSQYIEDKYALGVYGRGIQIGFEAIAVGVNMKTAFYLDMQNVSVSKCYTGIRVYHVVNNGLMKNVKVDNCFSNGIELYSNVITLEDMTYGLCGAAGIEVCPSHDMEAGVTFDQPQSVTFAGTITTTNYTKGDSLYMQNYTFSGVGVSAVIQGVVSAYGSNPDVLSNLQNANGEFVFISFVFNDLTGTTEADMMNQALVNYKNVDGAGIINANDLIGVDTTHKYIQIDVVYSGIPIGTVLLYNLNYQPQ